MSLRGAFHAPWQSKEKGEKNGENYIFNDTASGDNCLSGLGKCNAITPP
jgi:hypothetical protein